MADKYQPIYNIGAYEIQQYQQNRYPLFFLDVVEEVIPGEYVRAKKNFTYDELKAIGNILQSCKNKGYTTDEMKSPEMVLLRKLMYVKCIIDQTDEPKQQNIAVDQLDKTIGQTAESILETARNNLITLYGHRFKIWNMASKSFCFFIKIIDKPFSKIYN